jgi:mercuric ion transport protein
MVGWNSGGGHMEMSSENKRGSKSPYAEESTRLPGFVRASRLVYEILAWLFLICILIQVFIAGMATFTDPADWETHKAFVRMFALAPLVMFLLTFSGRIKGRIRWISLGLFGLVIFQFLTVQIFSSVFVLTALHPVIAMLMFWGSILTLKRGKGIRS